MVRFTTVFALIAFAAPAIADGPSYNYLTAVYQRADLDGFGVDVDGDGFGVGGSVEMGESFHLFGGINAFDFDFGVDLDEIILGGGFHAPIAENVDVVAELGYISTDVEALGFSVDDDGFLASVGVRSMLSPDFELAGSINYVDFGDGDDTSIDAEAWYNFTDTLAVGVGAEFGDDVAVYGVGLRFYFGT